jgi:hypothetical protein
VLLKTHDLFSLFAPPGEGGSTVVWKNRELYLIGNLTYSYTSNTNRLHKVLDGTTTTGDAKSRGFNGNLSTIDNAMTYDRNGNLNKNLHKNVSTITYNHLS